MSLNRYIAKQLSNPTGFGGKLTFSCQNANMMSFADNSFDKTYTINTVYFWEDLNATMSEIWRIVKPNGLFINTLFSNVKQNIFNFDKYIKCDV